MRVALVVAALLAAPLLAPAAPAAAQCPSVPIYPGSRSASNPDSSRAGAVTGAGHSYYVTDELLAYVQQYYYLRMPSEGWELVTLLPGQYPEQHANPGFTPTGITPQPVLEFQRGNAYARIVGEAGGYSIVLDCR